MSNGVAGATPILKVVMETIKFTAFYKVDAPNGETYEAGQYVDLPPASARHFVRRGVAEYAQKPKKKAPKPAPMRRFKEKYLPPEVADTPKHVGAGFYLLPDGTKVKGKEAAAEAMKKMKIGKTIPEPDRATIEKRVFSDS